MNRKEIKEYAKEKINGNKLEIWKGIIIVAFVSSLFAFPILFFDEKSLVGNLLEVIANVVTIPLSIGLTHYFINFVKNNTFDKKIIFDHYSEFVKILVTMILYSLLVMAGFFFFIIPGIILSLGLVLVPYLLILKKELSCMETIELSLKLMKGHKIEYFFLSLSFIGWILLIIPTFGLILIWLYPYMTTALTKFALNIIEEN